MKIYYTPKFDDSFQKFSKKIKIKFYKQIQYLIKDIHYRSLRVKKYNRRQGIWQARVDSNIRFYFLIKDNNCYLLDIKKHPK